MKKIKTLFYSVSSLFMVFGMSSLALAQEGEAAASSLNPSAGTMSIAIALGIGLAALGGTLGQGRAAAAALEGIARNPNATDKVFVPMILGMVFMESLVLFAWALMFLLFNKI